MSLTRGLLAGLVVGLILYALELVDMQDGRRFFLQVAVFAVALIVVSPRL